MALNTVIKWYAT